MSNSKTRQTSRSGLSERDNLARDLFLQLCCAPGYSGRTPKHNAGEAIAKAEAFFNELEKHKKSN